VIRLASFTKRAESILRSHRRAGLRVASLRPLKKIQRGGSQVLEKSTIRRAQFARPQS